MKNDDFYSREDSNGAPTPLTTEDFNKVPNQVSKLNITSFEIEELIHYWNNANEINSFIEKKLNKIKRYGLIRDFSLYAASIHYYLSTHNKLDFGVKEIMCYGSIIIFAHSSYILTKYLKESALKSLDENRYKFNRVIRFLPDQEPRDNRRGRNYSI